MSILCGTDFSEASAGALTAAAQLAARMQTPLHLLHSIELSAEALLEDPGNSYAAGVRKRLEHKAQRLRGLGAEVTVHVSSGAPDDALLATAAEVSAKLIVVAALGKRDPGKSRLGSHADRLAQRSHVPVLVVRESKPFCTWVQGTRPLRIALGADLSLSSKAAMAWIEALRAFGPCDVVAIHLYWPPEQYLRLGLLGARDYIEHDPHVTSALKRELERHLSVPSAHGTFVLRIEPHLSRLGDRVAAIAAQERADLVVVGTHDRSVVERLWEGSVSQSVLYCAQASVACIPATGAASTAHAPQFRSVLVATDLSAIGNAAIPLAYTMAPHGATIHVVHIVKTRVQHPSAPRDLFESAGDDESIEHAAARRSLAELIPPGALSAGKSTQIHILASNHAAEAICQAAERLNADVLCLGTHGRKGLSNAVLGSVAQAVVQTTRRPVLLAHEPHR